MTRKRQKFRGSVKKVIRSADPTEPEKAQIDIQDADELYREIRVPNVVADDQGEKSTLKEGANANIILEADSSATMKKPSGLS